VDQKNPIESTIQINPNQKKKRFLWFRWKTKPNQLKADVVWLGFNFKTLWTNRTKLIYISKLINFLNNSYLLKNKTRQLLVKKKKNLLQHHITNTNSETLKLFLPHSHSRKQPSINHPFDLLLSITLLYLFVISDFHFGYVISFFRFTLKSCFALISCYFLFLLCNFIVISFFNLVLVHYFGYIIKHIS
jgi:hypothetical protein